MPTKKDPSHWLYRLTAEEWLAAADTELQHCADTLRRRAFRPGVTHARRAVGMAWNAVLIESPDVRFGRSYMEHVAALAGDDHTPEAPRRAAQYLKDTSPAPPALVTLGQPDLAPLNAAQVLVDYARARALRTN
ncbi:MAG: hypothetical protein H7X95_00150 [Deltaproteobacteria bacterium]|nr:hypothetical protein [Deltaproteobacteria bacterium]